MNNEINRTQTSITRDKRANVNQSEQRSRNEKKNQN